MGFQRDFCCGLQCNVSRNAIKLYSRNASTASGDKIAVFVGGARVFSYDCSRFLQFGRSTGHKQADLPLHPAPAFPPIPATKVSRGSSCLEAIMSTGAVLPMEAQLADAVVGVGERGTRPRRLGAVLVEANMANVAVFEFLGGTVAVFTSRSPQKETPNEDVAALWPTGPASGVLAVADGLGGHNGGERASRLAIESLQRCLNDAASNNGDSSDLRSAILNGIESANQSVRGLGTGAATTLALVEIQDRTIRPYHVGDSEILLTGQRGKVKLQTIPHSPVGYAVESGLMEEEEAIHHEARHVISNVIGSDQMRIEIGPAIEMAQRDTLLLSSDGLLDNLLPDEIVELVRSGPLASAVCELVKTAQERMAGQANSAPSKPDDLTVIAYRPC
jgi:PPM family protein phosphatase